MIPTTSIIQPAVYVPRPALGIFGSLSSSIFVKSPDIADNLNLQAQSTFRSISLIKPDMAMMIKMLLKSEGFIAYEKLTNLTTEFIMTFIKNKNDYKNF